MFNSDAASRNAEVHNPSKVGCILLVNEPAGCLWCWNSTYVLITWFGVCDFTITYGRDCLGTAWSPRPELKMEGRS